MTETIEITGSHPQANVLVDGFRTILERTPENFVAMGEAMESTLRAFSPRNKWQVYLTDDVALMTLRLARIGRMDRRQRDQSALRAEFFWDDDRRLIANELGDRLKAKPEKTAPKLRATPQGCDWLLQRWAWLQGVLDAGKTWNETQTQLVFDLLGLHPEFRDPADARLADPARLVRDEVAALHERKARVAEGDALARSMAMADFTDPDTKEYRELKRCERSTHRRMKWAIGMLDLIPKFADAHPDILEERRLLAQHHANREAQQAVTPPPAAQEAPTTPPPPLPKPWIDGTPPIPVPKLPPLPHPTPTRRHDPVKLRAKARSEAARRRREDRPDR